MHVHPASLVLTLDPATLALYRQSAQHLGLRAADLASALLGALAPVVQGLPALERYGPHVGLHVVPVVGAVAFCEHEADLLLAPLYDAARARSAIAPGVEGHADGAPSSASEEEADLPTRVGLADDADLDGTALRAPLEGELPGHGLSSV